MCQGSQAPTGSVIIRGICYTTCGACGRPKRGTGRRTPGIAIWVTKDYVRRGKRVPFTDDWCRLCEACGFRLVCRHEATQVKERRTDGLFGEHVERTERKGFFRRLAEKKGSPRIDHEDVTCWVKVDEK